MEATEIKANLNQIVRFKSAKIGVDAEYRLTGAIFRRGKKGFFYQAELQDLKTRSIVICSLDDITAIERGK